MEIQYTPIQLGNLSNNINSERLLKKRINIENKSNIKERMIKERLN
ncbi:hypothetical protein [Bacillus mesophilum]|nr:hypothetical protein [Bacillus mesophilum]